MPASNGYNATFFVTYKVKELVIENPGVNYTDPTLVFTGGIGEGFSGVLVVNDIGAIVDLIVTNPGKNYTKGMNSLLSTSTLGAGAEITVSANDYGQIDSFTIVSGGSGYTSSDTFIVVASNPLNQQHHASADAVMVNHSITGTSALVSGSGYMDSPVITVADLLLDNFIVISCTGVEGTSTVTTTVPNGFDAVNIGDTIFGPSGWGYDKVEVVGKPNSTTLTLNRTIPVSFGNKSITVVPTKGKISKVDIINSGSNYKSLPEVVLPVITENSDESLFNDRRYAKLIPLSNSIGRIKSFRIVDPGVEYYEKPILSAPVAAIVANLTTAFRLNERVTAANWGSYVWGDGSLGDMTPYDGPEAIIAGFNPVNNIIYLNYADGDFLLNHEKDLVFLSEDGDTIAHELSFAIDENTVLHGEVSETTADVVLLNRADLVARNGAITNQKEVFTTNSGFTSDSSIKIHDGKRIQDYSYYIKTFATLINDVKMVLNLNEYKDTVSEMVHPAGYKMYGDVVLTDSKQIHTKLFSRKTKSGADIGLDIILTFVLGIGKLFRNFDVNALSNNVPQYRQLTIMVDEFVSLFKNVDYDSLGQDGINLKHRLAALFLELTTMLVNKVTLAEIWYSGPILEGYVAPYMFSRPSQLEKNKFVLDELTDANPDITRTYIGQFMQATFDDFNTNYWSNKVVANYAQPTFNTIEVTP